MHQPDLEFDEASRKMSEAHEQWKVHCTQLCNSIDNDFNQLYRSSSPVSKRLLVPVPEDKWKVMQPKIKHLSEQFRDIQRELFKVHYDKTVPDIVTKSSQDTLASILGTEEGGSKVPPSLFDLLKSLIQLLTYIFEEAISCLIDLYKDFIINLSQQILELVKVYLGPVEYERYDDIQDGTSKLLCIKHQFENWGETVTKEPDFIFFPKTTDGLCEIVKMAKEQRKGIRVSGFRHSWTDLWADKDAIQISMLPLEVTDKLRYIIQLVEVSDPDIPFHVIYDKNKWEDSEFVHIEDPIECKGTEDDPIYAGVRIGSAVCGLQLLEWIFKRKAREEECYQLPLDVIMSLNSYGGKISTMSHGSGKNHKTLSDLVLKIEYVDANGNKRTIDKKEQLNAAAGSLGMLGILTHITFKMEPITYASFQPRLVEHDQAIPKPIVGDYCCPDSYDEMEKDIDNSFYCEWFWFYGSKNVYKNTWKDSGNASEYDEPLVSLLEQEYQRSSSYLMGIVQAIIVGLQEIGLADCAVELLQPLIPHMAKNALIKLDDPLTVLAFDAIHFRRGINYLPVRCMEFLIPIPKNEEGQPDYKILQKAWWDVIDMVHEPEYEDNGELSPMNLTLEARIMDKSDIFLAPEFGNECGTCSIEVLGTMLVPDDVWKSFKNKVASKWASYKKIDGTPLIVRPHWAKEFPEKIGEKSCIDYVRDAHREGFKLFKEKVMEIAAEQGFTIQEMRDRFSNKFLEEIFGPLWDEKL